MELSGEAPRLYAGYDEYDDRSYLLSIYSDGTYTLAIRPGYRATDVSFGRPIRLEPHSSEITS